MQFTHPTVLLGLLCLWTWGIVKYSGLISFKIDGFHLIAVQGTLQSKCDIFVSVPVSFKGSSAEHNKPKTGVNWQKADEDYI